jgi:hypothetical protein
MKYAPVRRIVSNDEANHKELMLRMFTMLCRSQAERSEFWKDCLISFLARQITREENRYLWENLIIELAKENEQRFIELFLDSDPLFSPEPQRGDLRRSTTNDGFVTIEIQRWKDQWSVIATGQRKEQIHGT